MPFNPKSIIISNCVIMLLVLLTTPGISTMRQGGNLDVLCIGLLVLGCCQLILLAGRRFGVALATLLITAVLLFNVASKLYFQQQQTYLSVETLYLALELNSLIAAIPIWKTGVATATFMLLFGVIFTIAQHARIGNFTLAIGTGTALLLSSLGLQVLYTETTREDIFDYSETTPLGHLIRSTGLLPFVKFDHEWVANQRRKALVKTLLKNPSATLPGRYARDTIYTSLGRHSSDQEGSTKYPLYSPSTTTVEPEVKNKLNVLTLVLESVRASEMGIYGAQESATPFLDSLASKNVFVPNFYATSNFTVKSEHAIHCSTYDFMIGAPVSKRNIPVRSKCLPEMLSEQGYQTIWFHGNDKYFYSRDLYLPKIGFEKIYSEEELNVDNQLPTLGWGINDSAIFETALKKLESLEEPFYSEILTVSNHIPFEYEWGIEFPQHLAQQSTMFERYRRGIYYTDQAVKSFYERFKKSPLAENTILIITGDHGIWTFPDENKNGLQKNEEFFRVPLILDIPGLDNRKISGNHNHLDIAPTLLEILQFEPSNTFLGHSIFSTDQYKENRVLYMMTEQALSYRYKDKACIPTSQCQNNINCYREHEVEPAQTQCFTLENGYDLLLGQIDLVEKTNPNMSADRALFDYTQMALELGTTPQYSPHATNSVAWETKL